MAYNKYYKDNKKYYNVKTQKKVRNSYNFWENNAKKVAKSQYSKGWWGWQALPYVARTVDNWRYRRHIYNNKIRTYKVIGSRPRRVTGSRPY